MSHLFTSRISVRGRSVISAASLLAATAMCVLPPSLTLADEMVHRIAVNASSGTAAAVVVHDAPLIHTRQVFPAREAGKPATMSVNDQLSDAMRQLRKLLTESNASRLVKINLYAASEDAAAEILTALPAHFPAGEQPAASLVVTSLPVPGAQVAIDAVSCASDSEKNSVSPSADTAILPRGARIYVSGQAEQSESLADATRATLQSLHRTLMFLGRSDGDIVQLKAFLQPMSDAEVVRAEVQKFFAGKPVPPLILVEWKSSRTTPIEIELIAAGGTPAAGAPSLEFLTPPGMTASPVYCRVCRVNHPSTIYVGGLFSKHDRAANPDSSVNGELEVTDQFSQLEQILKLAQSDFQHLVKATYYVSTDSASVSLNKLRPGYYNPERPPAASKAVVSSVGIKDLGLTIDMIAVPKTVLP